MGYPNFSYEGELLDKGFKNVVGADEVGLGCLAGNIVVGAVCVPIDIVSQLQGKVKDSKKLSAKKRVELCDLIMSTCLYGIGEASPEEVDSMNTLNASKLATVRAIEKIQNVDYVLVDGKNSFSDVLDVPCESIIKGDNKSISIAAGSIIAKVYRDTQMCWADRLYPGYFFHRHKGYGTKAHCKAIETLGPCEIHRKTFKRVREFYY